MGHEDDALRSRISDSFSRQPLMQPFGAEIASIAPGEVEITAPILPGARQQHGFCHPGLTFALGDPAAGYAALTMMTPEAEVMTAEMKSDLPAPAEGGRPIASGRVVKAGRRLIVVTAEVAAESGGSARHVALLQGTMVPV